MRKSSLVGALLMTTTIAMAADLPTRPAPYIPPPPPPPMWTGPFVGLSVGGSWGDPGNDLGNNKGLYCVSAFCGMYPTGYDFKVGSGSSSDGSFALGGQVGYNYQMPGSQFVIGGVVDLTWLDRSASRKVYGPSVYLQSSNSDEQTFYYDAFKQDWLATARVRAGVAVDNVLLYVSGGLAAGGLDSSSYSQTTWTTRTQPPLTNTAAYGSGSSSGTSFGWAAGAGIEWRFAPNWSLFAEYLYYSLDDSYSVVVRPTAFAGSGASETYRVKVDGSGSLIKVGVNYLFWAPPPPVVVPAVVSVRN